MGADPILTEIVGSNYEKELTGAVQKLKEKGCTVGTLPGKRVKVLPAEEGVIYCASDIHGNEDAYKKVMSVFLEDLLQGKNAWLIQLGDLVHGHPDNDGSLRVLTSAIETTKLIGDHALYLEGNHEASQADGDAVEKDLEIDGETKTVNQTEELDKELKKTQGLYQASQNFFSDMPRFAKVPNGYAFSHSGPIKGAKKLSDLEDDNNKKIIESLRWGSYRMETVVVEDDEEEELRVNDYSLEGMENSLEVLSSDGIPVKLWIQGHSGATPIYLESTKSKARYEGIEGNRYAPDLGLLLLATAETMGPQNILSVDLHAKFGEGVYLADIENYKIGGNLDWSEFKIIETGGVKPKKTITKKEVLDWVFKQQGWSKKDPSYERMLSQSNKEFRNAVETMAGNGTIKDEIPFDLSQFKDNR
ncbi:metallophosphoesterase family protein [Nanoarchaeota archaeon]